LNFLLPAWVGRVEGRAPLLSRDDAHSVVHLACARWNAAEPADVAARVTREYAGRNEAGDGPAHSDDDCVPLEALLEATATAPDHVLAPRCVGARAGWKDAARHDTSEAPAARGSGAPRCGKSAVVVTPPATR